MVSNRLEFYTGQIAHVELQSDPVGRSEYSVYCQYKTCLPGISTALPHSLVKKAEKLSCKIWQRMMLCFSSINVYDSDLGMG